MLAPSLSSGPTKASSSPDGSDPVPLRIQIHTDTILNPVFYSLLRAALRQRQPDAAMLQRLTPPDWNELYAQARRQTVTALVFNAVSSLPDPLLPPDPLLMRWLAESEAIRSRSRRMDRTLARLLSLLSDHGIKALLLKGQAIAALYPDPESRQCGDIDLFIPDPADIERIISATGTADPRRHPDGSTSFTYRGVPVELHTRIFDIHSRASLRRLTSCPAITACASSPLPDGRLAPTPSPQGTLLMLSAHIFKHAAGRGIGMRQLCDMALAASHFAQEVTPQEMTEIFRSAGLLRWNRMLFSFLVLRLGLDPATVPIADGFVPSERQARRLERIILAGGNFGRHAGGIASHSGPAATAFSFLRRSRFALTVAPRETAALVSTLVKGRLRACLIINVTGRGA